MNAPETENRLTAYMTEYSAMREEIGWLVNGATQYQNFAIVLVGAYLGFLVGIGENASPYVIYVFLFAPLTLCLLGFLYFRQHEECYVVASYVEKDLAPRIRSLLGTDDVFGWEKFKASRITGVKPASRFIHFLRLILFLLPSTISMIAAFRMINWSIVAGVASAGDYTGPNVDIMLQGLTWVTGCVVFVFFTLYAFASADLPRRFLAQTAKVAAPSKAKAASPS